MKFCRPLSQKVVLLTAMRLLRSAQKEIVTTMDVDEELRSPLPHAYHRLIARKVGEGIVVKRFGFGSKQSFAKLTKKYTGIRFIYAGSMRNYQRMLVVDRKKALFALGGIVYMTDFVPLIESLVKYIKIIYNKEDL